VLPNFSCRTPPSIAVIPGSLPFRALSPRPLSRIPLSHIRPSNQLFFGLSPDPHSSIVVDLYLPRDTPGRGGGSLPPPFSPQERCCRRLIGFPRAWVGGRVPLQTLLAPRPSLSQAAVSPDVPGLLPVLRPQARERHLPPRRPRPPPLRGPDTSALPPEDCRPWVLWMDAPGSMWGQFGNCKFNFSELWVFCAESRHTVCSELKATYDSHMLNGFTPHPPPSHTPSPWARRPWRTAPALLAAWQEGRTGVPFVDANMRELRAARASVEPGRAIHTSPPVPAECAIKPSPQSTL